MEQHHDQSILKFHRLDEQSNSYHTVQTCILYSMALLRKSSVLIIVDPKECHNSQSKVEANADVKNESNEKRYKNDKTDLVKNDKNDNYEPNDKLDKFERSSHVNHHGNQSITMNSTQSIIGSPSVHGNQKAFSSSSNSYFGGTRGFSTQSSVGTYMSFTGNKTLLGKNLRENNSVPPLLQSYIEFLPQISFINQVGTEFALRTMFYTFLFQCMSSIKHHRADLKHSSGNLSRLSGQALNQISSDESGYIRCSVILNTSPEHKRLRSIIIDFMRNGQFEYGGIRYHLKGWLVFLISDSISVLEELNTTQKDSIMCTLRWREKKEKRFVRSVNQNELALSDIKVIDQEDPYEIQTQFSESSIAPDKLLNQYIGKRDSRLNLDNLLHNSTAHEHRDNRSRNLLQQNHLIESRSHISKRDTLTLGQSDLFSRQRLLGKMSGYSNVGGGKGFRHLPISISLATQSFEPLISAMQKEKSFSDSLRPKNFDRFNMTPDQVFSLIDTIIMRPSVCQYARDVIVAVRACPIRQEQISPVASMDLIAAAKGYALFCGYSYVLPDHVAKIAPYILSHRFSLKKGFTKEKTFTIVKKIIDALPRL